MANNPVANAWGNQLSALTNESDNTSGKSSIMPGSEGRGGRVESAIFQAAGLLNIFVAMLHIADILLTHPTDTDFSRMDLWAESSGMGVKTVGANLTAAEVLHAPPKHSGSSLLLVTLGRQRPQRRAADQPFVSAGPGVLLPTQAINAAAAVLEQARGQRLFPLHFEAADFSKFRRSSFFSNWARPFAIWDAGSGVVLVDDTLALSWGKAEIQWAISSFSNKLAQHTTVLLKEVASTLASQPIAQQLHSVLGPALAAAVAAAFAAAPPLWFCILCPTILGLVAPLAVNLTLNQIAGFLCVHLSLPDDECFDLLLGALGLGFVLSLASAIPIFYVCRLFQCSHRHQLV